MREEKKLEKKILEACTETTRNADRADTLGMTIRDKSQTGRLLELVQIDEQTARIKRRQKTGSVKEKSKAQRDQVLQRYIRVMSRNYGDLRACPGRKRSTVIDD